MEFIYNGQPVKTMQAAHADQIIEEINNAMQKGYFFSYFIADGEEVFENHEQYLEQHAGKIDKLEIIAKTEKQFANDLLLDGEGYLTRALKELPVLSEAFYDNPTSEDWTKLDALLGGLQWLDEMLMSIGRSNIQISNWQSYLAISEKMQDEIKNFAEALENEDNVLIGDIIQYELQPIFEEFKEEINTTIDNEGTRHDLS